MPTIVLVCGWLQGPARAVEIYSEVYNAMGFKNRFVVASSINDFFHDPLSVQKKKFQDFKKYLASLEDGTAVNIIPHVFSNGGCRVWYCFQQQLNQSGVQYRIPAIIIDSAPTKLGALEFGHQAFTATIGNPIVRNIAAFLVWISVGIYTLWLKWTNSTLPLDWQYKQIIQRDAAIPKLFLYSLADTMITPDNVEAAIQDAKQHNTPVTVVKFTDSKHVAHFVKYPDLYKKSILDFLAQYKITPALPAY